MFMFCICGFFGQLLLTRAYQIYDASKLAPFHYLQVAVGYFNDIVFLGNQPDTLSFVGSCLIVFLSLFLLKGKKKP